MTNSFRKWSYILNRLLEKYLNALSKLTTLTIGLFFFLFLLVKLIMSVPYIQNKLLPLANQLLSKALKTEITIEKISMDFPDYIVLNNVLIKDKLSVPMIFAKEIKIGYFSYDFWNMLISSEKKHFGARQLLISNASIHLYKSERTRGMSNWYLTFPPKRDTISILPTLTISKLDIDSLSLSYVDSLLMDSIPKTSHPRFTPQHFQIGVSHLTSSLIVENQVLYLNIDSLKAKEIYQQLNLFSLKGDFVLPLDSIGKIHDTLQIRNCFLHYQQTQLHFTAYFPEEDLSTLFKKGGEKRFQSVFLPSLLQFEDINSFLKTPIPLSGKVRFQGDIYGNTKRLGSHFLSVSYENDKLLYKGSVSLRNYTTGRSLFIQANGQKVIATTEGLYRLLPSVTFPSLVNEINYLEGKAKYIGFPIDFVIIGKFSSDDTRLDINSRFSFNQKSKYLYSGNVAFENLNFNKTLKIPIGEKVNGKAEFQIQGKNFPSLEGNLSGMVTHLSIQQKPINQGKWDIQFSQGIISGTLVVTDPKLSFQSEVLYKHFQNELIISTKEFIFDISKFGWQQLPLQIASRFHLRIIGFQLDSMNLNSEVDYLAISHRKYQTQSEWGPLSISYNAIPSKNEKTLDLYTNVGDAHLHGYFSLAQIESLRQQLLSYIQSFSKWLQDSTLDQPSFSFSNNFPSFQLLIKLTNTKPINQLFQNHLTIAKQTTCQLKADSSLTLSIISPYIQFKSNSIYDLNLSLQLDLTQYPLLLSSLSCASDSFRTSLSPFLTTHSIHFQLQKLKSKNYSYEILFRQPLVHHNIHLKGTWRHNTALMAHLITVDSSSSLVLFNTRWKIVKNFQIQLDTLLQVSEIQLTASNQKITFYSTLSMSKINYLLYLNSIPISYLDYLIGPEKRGIKGFINMDIQYQPFDNFLIANGKIDSFSYKNIYYGNLQILSSYNEERKTIESDISISHKSIQQVSLKGFYVIDDTISPLHFKLTTKRLPAKWFSPFLTPYLDQIQGEIVIDEMTISGSFKKPKLLGYAYFKKVSFITSLFKVPYSLSGLIKVNESEIDFPALIIMDKYQRISMISGKISHNYFQNIKYNINVSTNQPFYFMNTTKKDNDAFYGTIFVQSGSLKINGTLDYVSVKGTVQPGKGTVVNLPMTYYEKHERPQFIHFVSNNTDSSNKYLSHIRKTKLQGIDLDLYIEAIEDAEMRLIFDEQLQDMIKTRGKGTLHFQLLSTGEIFLFGTYEITVGDYLFTLKNIFNKRFFIQSGSKLTWEGDPYSATINITALYETTASLSALDSTLKGRVPVTLYLYMTGNLQQPNITFGIDFPALTYEQASGLVSQLRYIENDEQELNKQVFSILVFNAFAPISTSQGTFSATAGVASNVSEFLSNQLTNLLGKSLGQQVGIQLSSSQFNELRMNLKASLFKDRVTIERQGLIVGNQTQSPTLGNISIHIRLLPSNINLSKPNQSQLAIIIFNRENWGVSNYLLSTSRGGGIYLKKDFDKLLHIFK